ncbi:alpha/beta fold hydrolase [Alsobacter sp. KACC 23698]|uniref:alpha/beta fold hydrolase n=1 Tax=Alsobacter sp. KACC 23698 TaxID=3149229 RepID=UPI003877EE16
MEESWENPSASHWLKRLARFARVIAFDKRGTGLSDRSSALPGLDERMDDARAVMDAAQSRRAVLLGVSEGGSLACLFAATHPDRCVSLVLYGAFAKFPRGPVAKRRGRVRRRGGRTSEVDVDVGVDPKCRVLCGSCEPSAGGGLAGRPGRRRLRVRSGDRVRLVLAFSGRWEVGPRAGSVRRRGFHTA